MSIGEKFKRTGAFVIDLSIAKMFTQVLVGAVMAIMSVGVKSGGLVESLNLNDPAALPLLLALYVFILMLFIGIYVGYHWVCYRFLSNSLARYFLRLKVVALEDETQPVTINTYLTREFYKICLSLCTLGIYPAYSAAQYYTFSRLPYHDKKMQATVTLN